MLVLIISPLLSCEEADELLAKNIELPISFVININDLFVPEDSETNSYGNGLIYDMLSNPDVANAVGTPEQIKKIVINRVRYQYRNFSGNVDAMVSGQMGFNFESTRSFATESVNVAQASFTTEMFDLQGIQGAVMLLEEGNVLVKYNGISTANPIRFDARITIDATVTVEVRLSDL